MQCEDHPNVPAIANCDNCRTPLCGLCTNYTDSEVLCEKCVTIRETEQFVSAPSQQLEQPDHSLKIESPEPENFPPPGRRKFNTKALQWSIIGISFLFIAVRMVYYSNPVTNQTVGAEDIVRDMELASLTQCLLVFREIGMGLANGLEPDASPRCADSNALNIITAMEDDIRVAHPNPEVYGYTQIYVSRNNPDPTVVE